MADNYFDEYRKERGSCRTRAALNLTTGGDLKNLLKPLVKKAAKIIVKEPLDHIPADTQLKSHFGGQPYFEKGEKWPQAKNGNNLVFVFQVSNEDKFRTGGTINPPEYIKLIQFYYDFDDLRPWQTEDDGWLVKVYETLNKENSVIIKKPDEFLTGNSDKPDEKEPNIWVPYCEIEFEPMLSLPDYYSIWDYDETAAKLSRVLDNDMVLFDIT